MTQLVHTHVVGCFEARATPLDNPANKTDVVWDDESTADRPIRVTPESAQTFAPWWQGLNVIANGVAQLPLKVYQKNDSGRKEADGHASHKVLHRQPNKEMGPFTFKHLLQFWASSWGNGYAYIDRQGTPNVDSLWPIHPEIVTPFRVNGELFYDVVDMKGGRETYFASEIFHLRGPGDDGLQGKSVVKLARESLTVGLQAQRYGGQFFRNDAKPGIVIEVPNAVTEETAKNMLKHWERRHGGAHNAARPAFLDNGAKVSQFSMSNEDAQFLETRQFSKSEVAGWLILPPHMVGDLSRATFSNIEQQSIDYVVNSLMPWLIRWQDECNAKLLKPSEIESGSHYAEFIVEARLRGDFLSQMQGFQIGLTCGIYNQDEVRERLNLNRLPNNLGQTFYYSQNMTPVGTAREEGGQQEVEGEVGTSEKPPEKKAKRIMAEFIYNELRREYSRLGKVLTRSATTRQKLAEWHAKLPAECMEFARRLQPALEAATDLGLEEVLPSEVASTMATDFRLVIETATIGDVAGLKLRTEELTKKLAVDRAAELTGDFWETVWKEK